MTYNLNGALKANMHFVRFGTLLFLMAGGWFTLKATVGNTVEDVDSLKIKQEQISKDVAEINIKVAVTDVKIDTIKEEQLKQEILLNKILEEVMKD